MCQGILAIKSPGRKTKPSRPSPRQVLGNLGLPRKLYLLKALFMNHCNGIMLMRSTVVHQLVTLKMKILSSTKPTKHSASVHRGRGSSRSFHPVAKGWGGIKVITWVRHSTTLNGCWRQKQQKKRAWQEQPVTSGELCVHRCTCRWDRLHIPVPDAREREAAALPCLCSAMSFLQDHWERTDEVSSCQITATLETLVDKRCFYDVTSKNLCTAELVGKFQRSISLCARGLLSTNQPHHRIPLPLFEAELWIRGLQFPWITPVHRGGDRLQVSQCFPFITQGRAASLAD